MKIKILVNTVCELKAVKKGDVITPREVSNARLLVSLGKAVVVEDNPKAKSKSKTA